MNYSEKIKIFRIRKGLTQQQLADNVGVSRQSVARWENGWNVPSLYYAQKLSECLGVTVAELMNGGDANIGGESVDTRPAPSNDKCARGLIGFAIRFAALSFIPTLLLFIIEKLLDAITLGSAVTDALQTAVMSVGGVIFAILTAFLIARIIDVFGKTDDKYLRFGLFKTWNIGLLFLLINIVAFAIECIPFIDLMLPLVYCGATLIAAMIDFGVSVVMKRALRNKMISAHNKKLLLMNIIYAVISVAGLVAPAIFIIICIAVGVPTSMAEIGFAIFFFLLAAVLVDISYIIANVVVRARSARE